mgnify:CR=1 FL=1
MKKRKNDFLVELSTKQMDVTGSENLLRFNDRDNKQNLLLIDCGMLQEVEINTFSKENVDFNFDVECLRAVFITHAHNDHVGKLPFLIKAGYEGRIYMSKETSLFLENVLSDNLKIHREEAKKQNKKPLYDEDIIEKVISLIEPVEYKQIYGISLEGVQILYSFYRNNHIVGASTIWLRTIKENEKKENEKINFLFSGDLNISNKLLKKDIQVPKRAIYDKNINIIMESTYGTTTREEEKINIDLEEQIREAVLNKKKVLIPINALHKAQEVLEIIRKIKLQMLEEKIEFPKVYLDGKLAIKHTYTYAGILKRNFIPSGLIEVFDDSSRMEAIENPNSIILSTAGMMSNGPVVDYIKKLLPDENTKLIVVSYCAEGTVGRKLLEKVEQVKNARKAGKKEKEIDKSINLFGKEILVNADVERVTSISTHARQEEMLEFLKNFKETNVSSILLNHGEEIVREKFKKVIQEKLDIDEGKIHLFDKRNKFIFSKYGLEKKVPIIPPIIHEEKEKGKERKEKKEKKIIKREKV